MTKADLTHILSEIKAGRQDATERLLPVVYEELRGLARQRLRKEPSEHTLQPTALVHEAYLKLIGPSLPPWENRAHFFAAAAEAMRRILVDHVRSKKRLKRGGGFQALNLDPDEIASAESEEILALDMALSQFEKIDPEKAQLVKLRFFGGLSSDEAADAMGISPRTAQRFWAFSRAWLYREIKESS